MTLQERIGDRSGLASKHRGLKSGRKELTPATCDPPLRHYHGIRLYLNDGKMNFTEKYFYPMYGALRAVAGDLTGDGRLDLVLGNAPILRGIPRELQRRFLEESKKVPSVLILEGVDHGTAADRNNAQGLRRPAGSVPAMSLMGKRRPADRANHHQD